MIIGLGHRARQGKDEIGKVLEEQYGFEVLHFADPLKEEVAKYFGWTIENKNILARDAITSENWLNVENADGYSYFTASAGGWKLGARFEPGIYVHAKGHVIPFGDLTLLQWFGTEFRRRQIEYYWVDRTFEKIDGNKNAVICDMRFFDEAEAVKSHGGLTVKIERLGQDGSQFIDPDRDPNHPSEIDLIDYDFDYQQYIYECEDPQFLRFSFESAARAIYKKAKEKG